ADAPAKSREEAPRAAEKEKASSKPRTAKPVNPRPRRDEGPRDIHNEVCDGHMPAFLMRDPLAPQADAKTDEKKPDAKRRRPRRKPTPKSEA
ncbi:MAG: hypothetical protein HQL35_15575, partial [Alphaproteobacteria bacterium]|nr:hypothetical protein [Alphaproteobacteria bacterium]